MKYKSILFDLDGTLWDSSVVVERAWIEALDVQPDIARVPTREELQQVMGMNSVDLMAKLFPYLSVERRAQLFEEICQVEMAHLLKQGGVLFPGMEDTVKELSKTRQLFIVSNFNDGYIECFLDAHHMRPYFTDWECVGRTGLQKGDNIRLVVERNGLESPVYVGDTPIDYEAAQKAGIPFLHAAYGFGEVPGVQKLSAITELLSVV